MIIHHPRPDEHGKPVLLKRPSRPTPVSHWSDPNQLATVLPEGAVPDSLNGIDLLAWADAPTHAEGWETQAQRNNSSFTDPTLVTAAGRPTASGVVILEGDGRVWVISPSNSFGGYENTFPKGRLDPGMSLRANALKEAFEESGLQVALTGFLCDAIRSASVTRYYTGRRLGGHPGQMCWETQAVHLVPRAQLAAFASHPNDKPVLQALDALAPHAA